jgi:hypothetical protein
VRGEVCNKICKGLLREAFFAALGALEAMVPLKVVVVYYAGHFVAIVFVGQAMRLALPLTVDMTLALCHRHSLSPPCI